jgi:O-antigen/teichoic acid export membrane protein
MSLGQTTIRGVAWNFAELLLRRGIAAATTLVLAYFLSPADFGLISMSALFLAVAAGLMDSGLREGLIRRRYLSARLLNAAMVASIGLGGCAYLLLFLAAPWVAQFYAEPRLLLVIRVGGLAILFNALQMVPIARLQQALDFKSLMQAAFPATLISSLLALAMAWAEYGVWALIVQNLVATALMTILLWRVAGRPLTGRVDFRLLLSIYRFGYKLFLSSLIALAVRNSIPGMLGKFLGATTAGHYYFVDKIMEMIMGQLVYSIQNVTYPAFSKISTESELLLEAYRKVIKVMIFVISPLLMIGAALAEPLFQTFFSRDWLPAADCFRGLCVVYLLYPMHALNLNILKVKGRTDLFFWLEVFKAMIALTVLWFALPYGLEGVLLGQIFVSIICYLPNAIYSKPLIAYSVGAQFMDVFPYFACSAAAGGVAVCMDRALSGQPGWFVLLLGTSFSAGVYLLLCWLLRLQALSLMLLALRIFRGKST